MNNSNILEDSKKEIRSILIAYQKGCFLSEFIKAYKDLIGRRLPSYELGYKSDIEFLYSIPDVVRISSSRYGEYHLLGIADEKSKHIQKMVCKQKPAKLKMPSRSRPPRYYYSPPPRFTETAPITVKQSPEPEPVIPASTVTVTTAVTSNQMTPREEIISLVKEFEDGIPLNSLLDEYEGKYTKTFSFTKYGFSSLKDCIVCISELDLVEENDELIVCHSSYNIRGNAKSSKNISEENSQNYRKPSISNSDKSGHNISARGNIPESMKDKLQMVAEKIPHGILASDFPRFFEEIHGAPFDLHSFGYNCLADFIDDASDIFIREPAPGSKNEYFIYPVDEYGDDPNGQNSCNTDTSMKKGASLIDNVIFNIRKILEANSEGIELQEFLHVYSINCKASLCIKDLGFSNIETFLFNIKDRVPLKFEMSNGVKSIHLLKFNDSSNNINVPADVHQLEAIPYDAEFPNFQFKQQTFPSNFDNSKYIPVYISSVANPSHLYIQLHDETQDFGKMADELDNCYNGPYSKHYLMKSVHIKVEACCAALWPNDQHWYRVQILSIPSMETVEVIYVDYGTRAVIPRSLLRYIRKDFVKLPVQAIRCSLAFLKPPKNAQKWDVKVKQRLLQLCGDIPLMAKIGETRPDGVYSIVLCDTNGDNDVYINDLLHEEGLADIIKDSDTNVSATPEKELQPEYPSLNPLQALQAQYFLQAFATVAPSFSQNKNYLKLLKQVSMSCPNPDPLQPNPSFSLNLGLSNANLFPNMLPNPYLMQNSFPYAPIPFGSGSHSNSATLPFSNQILPPTNPQNQVTMPRTYSDNHHTSSKSSGVPTIENRNNESDIFDEDDDDLFQQFCQKVCPAKARHVKRVFLGDSYKIHIIVVDSKPYASSGDISQLIWNNKEADYLSRRLQLKDADFPTINLSEDGNEECFQQLERLNVKGVQKTTGFKPSILLYPLKVVIKILNLFGHPSISLRTKLTEEIARFDPDDPIWKEFTVPESAEPEEDESLLGVTDDDKIERLCLYDLLAMKEGIKCKRLKMMNNLKGSNNSICVDEIQKLEQLQAKVLQRIQEIKEICNLFA